ncbi:hypothetical protein [uncultured Selenomonas sp.]|uniref:DUF7884 domain-containing protein n=1 Tax=uncultured Selenomonas sp. TaxID=159275 RepID=UPI0025DCA94F|nr:hypothetical protein [uncultured Selenomonas sp.]
MIFKQLMDSFLIHYLGRFDKFPFNVEMHGDTYQIGEGEPEFTIKVNKDIPKKDLMASTSLALAEAYMRHDIEIKDGDLFNVIAHLDCSRSPKKSATSSGRSRATMTSATTSTSSGSTRR